MTVGVPTTEHPRLKRRLGWLRASLASYLQQLKGRAIDVPWGPLPADEPVTEGHLVATGDRDPLQWLVVGNLDATGAAACLRHPSPHGPALTEASPDSSAEGGPDEYLASESPAAFVTVALQHNQCDMSWHTSLVAKVADAQEQAQGNGHWWQGMSRDVEYVVNRCTLCDRANSSGNVVPSQLHSLPLRGPFYRWHVDLAGDLTPTPEGYRYVLVCVEAWTKHVEMIPLRTKGSQEVANAFLANVLARFSAPAEVVSDGKRCG
ncbi:hypothetical protein GPECTOR_63g72 [Gonium pectorale]|uniref:Integrase catalytic domain-containing protein n=1 Tax=Gonium pectorale TaxID=33097 RepID=A0A150G4K1_GONPE|nr:hypothetical protein GPECTOR_63g72 [Gonium pectorale]|eukprot:KXZ44748.1 hypothetical protein GPECTOR_63g72 [Gonium pectorale]